ncbi:alpha/beta fold hydrolase [Salinisphaera sp. Q1T1-3]|uniref:alpha/beta fold hydrolase n=1 Tax=Salinisphaera sp. Q1T1-3 TaxID=2321229 RepID=UPI000E70C77E|nr:alpha/beta fold hydrolase [Salinisphaera sp. Q1T1-3]RJS91964.1 alpha/beta fold hydrolase [Salinisphaera sp. Q1T1-3]
MTAAAPAVRLTAVDGGVCRLTYLAGAAPHRAPVALLHGMFTDRRFWLSDKGIGLAAYLATAGHPVYILQRRGLSDSPRSRVRCGLDEHLYHDVPALAARILAEQARAATWIGHSFGGVLAARAVAEVLPEDAVAGLVLIASQFECGKRLLDWPGNLLTRAITALAGRLPARLVGLGPVDEPAAAVHDACTWVETGRRAPILKQSLSRITVPVLAISGAADRVDPTPGCRRFVAHMRSRELTFIHAARHSGLARDYDHAGVVVSHDARREIWPRITTWLDAPRA